VKIEARDEALDAFVRALPAPFCDDRFRILRTGIADDPTIAVLVNEAADFAALFPPPRQEYEHYRPRFATLGLGAYRTKNRVVERRLDKIADEFARATDVLEIGAFDGALLRHAAERHPHLRVASLEIDVESRAARETIEGLEQFSDFAAIRAADRRFDLIGFFHVLEHVLEPARFLADCRTALAPGGRIVLEVPSLDDPLLALYQVPEFQAFYFQRQHPYVYSARSATRLLEAHRLAVERVVPHQRYGLENHLTWLAHRRPGGDETLRRIFDDVDDAYRARLEAEGFADAVIMVARVAD
jgi:SAM-dependent methyltransferase